MVLLGEQHQVRVVGTELGVVVVTVKTMPQLKVATINRKRAKDPLQA